MGGIKITPMPNPMTTAADMLYASTGGAPTRLANGTAGQVLQSNGTTVAPSWAAAGQPTLSIQTATSATKTPSASNNYHALTTNSVSLTAGTWELSGSARFSFVTSSPLYTDVGVGFWGANGADSSSSPTTTLAGIANLTVNSADLTGSSTYINTAGSFAVMTVPLQNYIVTVTATVTVYIVTYSVQTTTANARVTAYINARKLY